MLRSLALRDFVIVTGLEVELAPGFSVLTGETGAGKSILIDALQLALGERGDAGVVREGAARGEITAEFDVPAALHPWLRNAGFEEQDSVLLRRLIDAQGKSRAWINGSAATAAQLREVAEHLVDIHGQHAWQSLTRSASVRELLDAYARIDTAPLANCWSRWKAAGEALQRANTQQAELARNRERLAWQVGEVNKLAPAADEWETLNADHRRLSNAQALIDAARTALAAISEGDANADGLTGGALDALRVVAEHDQHLSDVVSVLEGAQAQLHDAASTLRSYLHRTEPNPEQLLALDERLSSWVGLARRHHCAPQELPARLAQWHDELQGLDAATDLTALESTLNATTADYTAEAAKVSEVRQQAAPLLAEAVTQAINQLGMTGGRFEVVLQACDAPQSFGQESAEFMVAGHAGATPRPLSKVASGGELARIALAVAVTTSQLGAAGTLIFDEIDAGIGGAVAETVGRMMKRLGQDRQVLAVTHLAQVAASADHHYLVSKVTHNGATVSTLHEVSGESRVSEIARMLGGERLSGTSLAHAQELLTVAAEGTSARRSRRRA